MQLHVDPVPLDNRRLYGTRSALTALLACAQDLGRIVFHAPWAHIVTKAVAHVHHVKQIASQVKGRLNVSPAPLD